MKNLVIAILVGAVILFGYLYIKSTYSETDSNPQNLTNNSFEEVVTDEEATEPAPEQDVTPVGTPDLTPTTPPTEEKPVTSWDTYENKSYGYEVEYPVEWSIRTVPNIYAQTGVTLHSDTFDSEESTIKKSYIEIRGSDHTLTSIDEAIEKNALILCPSEGCLGFSVYKEFEVATGEKGYLMEVIYGGRGYGERSEKYEAYVEYPNTEYYEHIKNEYGTEVGVTPKTIRIDFGFNTDMKTVDHVLSTFAFTENKPVALNFECQSQTNQCLTVEPTLSLSLGDSFDDFMVIFENKDVYGNYTGLIAPGRRSYYSKELIHLVIDGTTTYCERDNTSDTCDVTGIENFEGTSGDYLTDRSKLDWNVSGNKVKGTVINTDKTNITIKVSDITIVKQ